MFWLFLKVKSFLKVRSTHISSQKGQHNNNFLAFTLYFLKKYYENNVWINFKNKYWITETMHVLCLILMSNNSGHSTRTGLLVNLVAPPAIQSSLGMAVGSSEASGRQNPLLEKSGSGHSWYRGLRTFSSRFHLVTFPAILGLAVGWDYLGGMSDTPHHWKCLAVLILYTRDYV